ncbi:MAG: putative secreted hydrolase [Cytophagales bacterium]|jgi:peptidoglycan/xylan/chitin deacetylase (PgdA/CDA1 family)|nr:polysaccharide deacetylase family protein [Bacteroidota bacterium]MBS1980222.1 polysaccharide deacetylase family protein [Bacteroidota bacterium]WHZ08741.1 MAG: putative secreted hydrolase [Cytophagales bacterium]
MRFYLSIITLLASIFCYAQKKVVVDPYGAIVRGDTTKKEIALVFTGDEFADGGDVIISTLKKYDIKGSFFLTGKFYTNPNFKNLIYRLKDGGHYLGPHSDQHLLYADWTKRDSMLVTENEFKTDLKNNYERIKVFGIKMKRAPYFIPPFEWYNLRISKWAKDLNLVLINFSPGTRSTADYTYPEMGKQYVSSEEIYHSILKFESSGKHHLNGFILLIHIGTDPRRTDKLYNKMDTLISELRKRNYTFRRIDEMF